MASERRRYVVGAWKLPHEQRDVAHEVITPDDDRGFFNIIRAEDEADIGKRSTYRVELTDEEAARFRAASNARYVELDRVDTADDYDDFPIPQADVLEYLGADGYRDTWHGRDVLVAIADDGTTAAARNYMRLTLVGRRNFANTDPGSGTNGTHGCKVLADLVPVDGQVLDVIISDPSGAARSNAVAGWAWAADQGAKVINYSYSGAAGSENSVYEDGVRYLAERGIPIFCSAGNDGIYGINTPANYSRIYPNVISTGAFNQDTNERASFSNHHPRLSGVAPGDFPVWGLTTAGVPVEWSGTSASTPFTAQLCAMGLTGGHFTPMQVATALKRYVRDTGEPDSDQGAGAFDFGLAITELTKTTAAADSDVTTRSWKVASGPAQVGATLSTAAALSWTPTTAGIYVLRYSATSPAGTTTDDVTVDVSTSGGGGTPANPGEALWIGGAGGKNHFNIGIGQPGGGTNHTDTDMPDIEDGFDDSPWFTLTSAGDAQFRMNVEYGRTSSGTKYARSELRELTASGAKAAWNGSSGVHYMKGRSRITHVAPAKPWVVIFQVHDAESDLHRVQLENGNIRARWTPPGSSDAGPTTLLSGYTLGDWIDWELRIASGTLTVTLNDEVVQTISGMGTSGCYFKTGCYNQASNASDGGGATPGDYFQVEIAKGSLETWHTGYPDPTTPVFTG